MCTILLESETLPAEKRSRKDTQKAVDQMMEYERRLTAPFDREELTVLLKKEPKRNRQYPLLLTDTEEQIKAMARMEIEDEEQEQAQRIWNRWQLLTEEEKQLAENLGLTPVQPKPPKKRNNIWDTIARIGLNSKTESVEEQRLKLKTELFHIPRSIYVWLDSMNYCSAKKGFYYVRYQNSMLWNGTTAYAHPVLVVQKSKLRPDQVEYMERKCAETRNDANKSNDLTVQIKGSE